METKIIWKYDNLSKIMTKKNDYGQGSRERRTLWLMTNLIMDRKRVDCWR
jgi:hypothetical protein